MRIPRVDLVASTTWLLGAWMMTGCAISHRPFVDVPVSNDAMSTDVVGPDASIDDVRADAGDTDGPAPLDGGDAPIAIDAPDIVNPPDTSCAAGTALCGTTCVSLTTPDRCGSCTRNCQALPGVNPSAVACAAGACVIRSACAAGRADCDGLVDNGCEADLSRSPNCGVCGVTCGSATPLCAANSGVYACSSGCGGGQMLCPSGCATLASDPANCGTCGVRCAAPAGGNGEGVCTASVCSIRCSPGFHLCGTVCVADFSTTQCGATCVMCTAPTGGSVACTGGACVPSCLMGTRLCPGARCLADNEAACGASCAACPASPPNGTVRCTGGSCGLTCMTGYVVSGTTCVPMAMPCGNRVLDAGEGCDDGNTMAGDGCSASCQMEAGFQGDLCSSPVTTTLRPSRGTSFYTGDTSGFVNDGSGTCGATGPDVVVHVQIPAGATMGRVTVRSIGGWDIILRGITGCPGACIDTPGTSTVETSTFTGTGLMTVVIDGFGGMGGRYSLELMFP